MFERRLMGRSVDIKRGNRKNQLSREEQGVVEAPDAGQSLPTPIPLILESILVNGRYHVAITTGLAYNLSQKHSAMSSFGTARGGTSTATVAGDPTAAQPSPAWRPQIAPLFGE
eukprot:GHVU01201715.1.p2 GENE.GHVU01201715.1~~GHVU01201715.1.p2  ORF type:complete len:114 (-),score=7.11 GHVU01201715.1:939-1280(-)